MKGNKFSQNRLHRCAILILIVVLALLLSGCCQQKPKVYRVGVLSGLEFIADVTDGFKEGMTERGYVEGENIVYDVQRTDFDMEKYRSILKQFVADDVDLIFVFPTETAVEAKAVTEGTGIPVVFDFSFTEGTGLVESLREPGGNITGVRYPGPDVALKRFEIMRELAPQATRMWIPYQAGYPSIGSQLEILRPAAEAAGITLIEAPAADAAGLEAALQAHVQPDGVGFDAILFLAEPLAVTPEPFAVMGKFAYEHKIPIGGALMSAEGYDSAFGVNVNSFASGKQAAPLVDKVLKGTPAGTLPVASAENFIQINYSAAQRLGLTVPESVLVQADEIIR